VNDKTYEICYNWFEQPDSYRIYNIRCPDMNVQSYENEPEYDIDGFIVCGRSMSFLRTGLRTMPKARPRLFGDKAYFSIEVSALSEPITLRNTFYWFVGETDGHQADAYLLLYDVDVVKRPYRPERTKREGFSSLMATIIMDTVNAVDKSHSSSNMQQHVPDFFAQDLHPKFFDDFWVLLKQRLVSEGVCQHLMFFVRKFGQKRLCPLSLESSFLDSLFDLDDADIVDVFVDVGVTWTAGDATVMLWKRSFLDKVRKFAASNQQQMEFFPTALCSNIGDANISSSSKSQRAIVMEKLYSTEVHTRRIVGQMPFLRGNAMASMLSDFCSSSKAVSGTRAKHLSDEASMYEKDIAWFRAALRDLRTMTGKARWELTIRPRLLSVRRLCSQIGSACAARSVDEDTTAAPFVVIRANDWASHLSGIYEALLRRIALCRRLVLNGCHTNGAILLIYYSDLLRFFVSGNRGYLRCWKIWDMFRASRLAEQGLTMYPGIPDIPIDEGGDDVSLWLSETIGSYTHDIWKLLQFHNHLRYGTESRIVPFAAACLFADTVLDYVKQAFPEEAHSLCASEFMERHVRILRSSPCGSMMDIPQKQCTLHELLVFLLIGVEGVQSVSESSHVVKHMNHVLAEALSIGSYDAAILLIRSVCAHRKTTQLGRLLYLPCLKTIKDKHVGPSSFAELWEIVEPTDPFMLVDDGALSSISNGSARTLIKYIRDCSADRDTYSSLRVAQLMKNLTKAEVLATKLVCWLPDGSMSMRRSRDTDHFVAETPTVLSAVPSMVDGRTESGKSAAIVRTQLGAQRETVSALVIPAKGKFRWTDIETVSLLNGLLNSRKTDWIAIRAAQGFDGTRFKEKKPCQLKDRWKTLKTTNKDKLSVEIRDKITEVEKILADTHRSRASNDDEEEMIGFQAESESESASSDAVGHPDGDGEESCGDEVHDGTASAQKKMAAARKRSVIAPV
jgi:hypothetical protein